MKVAVIGNGIIGLTTAIKLMSEGREVIIYTKDPNHTNTTSTVSLVACALWQPYKLFNNLENLEENKFKALKNISLNSLKEFDKIIAVDGTDETGVYIKTHYEYSFESITSQNTCSLKNDFYYIDILKDFWNEKDEQDAIVDEIILTNHLPFKALDKNQNEQDFKYLHGYKTYAIDPSVFLKYLTNIFLKMGGEIVEKQLNLNELKKIKEKIIFNCSGSNGFSLINHKNNGISNNRKMAPKKGVLLLYNLKEKRQFENTIVLDELTILCRKNELTIGTGEVKEGEDPNVLIERLKYHAKQFVEAEHVDKFGFDTFVEQQSIDLNKPNYKLIGARPYIPDGQGYVLNREDYKSVSASFALYNNFGHGGSGVTLSWGCAIEITNLYLLNVQKKLDLLNCGRIDIKTSDFSIELAHFEIKELRQLSSDEIDELLEIEKQKLNEVIEKLKLKNRKYSISVLIDDKDSRRNDKDLIIRFSNSLSKIGVDYIAYESRLITYVERLQKTFPKNIAKEFNKKMQHHHKLGCSQDIFVWYGLRFGIADFSYEDQVINPISNKAKNGDAPFIANSLITLLKKDLASYEDNADEYLMKSYGYEIASSIRRFYY